MAADAEKLATVTTTTDNAKASAEGNPKNNVGPMDLEQNPGAAVNSSAVEVKKNGNDSKTAVTITAVSPVSGDADLVTDTQKKIRRAERFGMPVQMSEEEKRNTRAERFGTGSKTQGSEVSKTSEELKRKARAERFGLPVPSSVSEEEAKRKARLARFAPYPKTDSVEEDKRKARALRFSKTSSSSVSQVNGKENIEAKAAITGEADGVA